MLISNLNNIDENFINVDLALIGAGPVGLTIAKALADTGLKILLLESGGLTFNSRAEALNQLEFAGDPKLNRPGKSRHLAWGGSSDARLDGCKPFELRNRIFGGSTHTWTGKCAAFDEIDFEARDWVAGSGWPLELADLQDDLDRAAQTLNLGPNCYDEALWERLGVASPVGEMDREKLRSFFWQFSKSPSDPRSIMRFGKEYSSLEAPNLRVLLDATVTHIDTNGDGTKFQSLQLRSLAGKKAVVKARAAVLCAGGIENARLLLLSRNIVEAGVGNRHDMVGRHLMDHPQCRLATFATDHYEAIRQNFGFHYLSENGGEFPYLHGLCLSPALQRQEKLLNCAVFVDERRASDNPWDAMIRVIRKDQQTNIGDLVTVARQPGTILSGLYRRLIQKRGLPHKVESLVLGCLVEQRPDPDNRVALSAQKDAFGLPRARIEWRVSDMEKRTIARMGHLISDEFQRIGLPRPRLCDWVRNGQLEEAVLIDAAHPTGTTRMSDDPKSGVVDRNCRVHGVDGLYVAGSSVFPTSGHANPTLMILALAHRLARTLRQSLTKPASITLSTSSRHYASNENMVALRKSPGQLRG